jgi:hypothetical protein
MKKILNYILAFSVVAMASCTERPARAECKPGKSYYA